MKKVILFMFSMIALASCSKHDFTEYSFVNQQRDKFETKFETEFGTPASDQDWGFENIQIFDYTMSSTRGHDVNRNQWYGKYIVPANVTEDEEQAVLNELATGNYADAKMTEDWSNFFVYHVHKGTDSYPDHNNSDIGTASDYMNHLQAGKGNATASESGELVGTWEHVNDFNSGQQTANWWTIEGATLMLNSGTANFAYHNSRDSKYHDCFTVVDGKDIGYPGFYYICFDFLANGDIEQPDNKNMGVDRNHNYTDWIIRVSPAKFNMEGAVRIIAEDLGDSQGSDFDYNDVVFDVKLANEWDGEMNSNRLKAYIVLRAAGGTLPLTVAGEEVHAKFGKSVGTMINTDAYGDGINYNMGVEFVKDLGEADWNINGSDAAKNLIPIVVTYKNGEKTALVCETGHAPEKICVRTTFKWQVEYINIRKKYPLFSDWVLDKTVDWQ